MIFLFILHWIELGHVAITSLRETGQLRTQLKIGGSISLEKGKSGYWGTARSL